MECTGSSVIFALMCVCVFKIKPPQQSVALEDIPAESKTTLCIYTSIHVYINIKGNLRTHRGLYSMEGRSMHNPSNITRNFYT